MDARDAALGSLIDRILHARAHGVGLDIHGGGTKAFYGRCRAGEPLQIGALTGISSYEPTELVVTARAGTTLAEMEAVLEESGQCLPFEPPRFAPGGTLGGMVAAGLAGPARAYVGGVRDHVLGITMLNGSGELLTFGGQVAKNVAGYDVSRLMAGSLGILGVLCEISLKVLPRPQCTATRVFELDEAAALNRLKSWASQPLSISGSAWHAGRLHVRLSGARAAVEAACRKLGGSLLSAADSASWWPSLRDQTHPFFAFDAGALGGESLWRLSLPATADPLELAGEQLIEWHGAERWWRSSAPAQAMRAAAARVGGHATLMRGGDRMGAVFAPLSETLMTIHRRLKQAFDPAAVFNRGRLYAEL
jgi:FAD/FMN-containing dehydrogenase